MQVVGPGSGVTKQFLCNREEILSSMGAALFQGEGRRERRARVKTLFASIDMEYDATGQPAWSASLANCAVIAPGFDYETALLETRSV